MIRSTDNFFMRNATVVAIATIAVIMSLAAFIFYRQGEASVLAREWVHHTYEVRGHTFLLLSKLSDAETSQRGYLITGDEEFLENYKRALQNSSNARAKSDSMTQHHSIAEEIDILRRMTVDNPIQQQNIDDLDISVKELLNYLASGIEARKAKNSDSVLKEIDFRHGKEIMDNLRHLISMMRLEEDHLMALRIQADEATTQQNNKVVFIGIAIFFTIKAFAVWLYQRARKRAQVELLSYTQQLERSEEELKVQQEELKASNEEIEASNEELEEQNAQIRQQSEELAKSKRLIEEKAREADLASKYKTEFLANMSHELRTPLNSLLILARSLANNEDGNLTEGQIEEARIIHNDGLELLNLINDILDLSKVEAGKLSIITENVSLDGIVKHLQQQFVPIAKERNVAFPVEIENDLAETLHTDAQRVEQILKNLLSNAFKFTEKGSVTLKVHRPDNHVTLQRVSLEHENAIAFSVTDTGIGIETSKLKDIFEAFQQEDGSIDRHYGGTGLGLTIARKFAHLLGGEIHVTSAKGKGSTFTLMLPTQLKRQTVDTPKAMADADLMQDARTELKIMPRTFVPEFIADDRKNIGDKDKVLLIIEDDSNFATVLMKIARKRGYKCLVAGNGKTGLLLAMEEPVTAIILDLKLPDIDGMQVLDQLKNDLKSRHIPVHIITGREEEYNLASLRKGAIGYLQKPVEQEGIEGAFSKIESLLQAGMKRILVIEDDQKNQIAIQSLLKKKDIHLAFVSTGAAALEQIQKTRFDCVILDLNLPDMSGFQWLEKTEKEPGDKIMPPVIVYTARELTEEENRYLSRYTGSIIIKGAKSPERLLDEVTLFLHSVESTLSKDQQEIIRMQHNPDKVLQGRTVLLTDDDLRNTFALSKLLKKHGVNVVIADNGQMALQKLEETKTIDLIIMDIMMPVMDGYQTMQKIREHQTYQNVPIIALTARAMPEEQEKCMAAGANDYLTKPVDIERLLTLMRVWLFKQEMAA